MSEKEELEQLSKIDPKVLQTMLLYKMYKKLDKLSAFATFMGPMARMFKRDLQFQRATVSPGQYRTVWYMVNPQPDLLVGIITQVANDWFPNTVLEWFIDYHPKRVQYIIGQIDHPKEYERGIPFHDEVKWVAYNNDTVVHTFGVLCDGFFISKKLFNKIV